MEQHPIPRQITSFEFKLIGFMTLHQFIYLLVFIPSGFAVYKLIPIPFVNILIGFMISSIGVLLAFLPINDRPLDVFIKNLFKRLTSPTQYMYKKSNHPLYFLNNLYFVNDPHKVLAHVESQEMLSEYLKTNTLPPVTVQTDTRSLVGVQEAFKNPTLNQQTTTAATVSATESPSTSYPPKQGELSRIAQQPFFLGVVKNNKETPLPEILVYIKDERNNPVRLLKTNPHGVFATYNSLPGGEYFVEAKDPRGSYLFDTMKVRLDDTNPSTFNVVSKGLL